MNSFNHYAYGAIGDWMYRVSAGIETKTPGYRNLLIQPHVSGKLNFSKASFESPYGKIVSGWERKDGKVFISVILPANTKATICLPVNSAEKVTIGGKPLSADLNLSNLRIQGEIVMVDSGSGEYLFEIAE
jgi:alpha-L-rhamnosidase